MFNQNPHERTLATPPDHNLTPWAGFWTRLISFSFCSLAAWTAVAAGLLAVLAIVTAALAAPAWAEEDEGLWEKRLEWFYQRRAGPDGSFPTQARERGITAMRTMKISPMQRGPSRISPQGGALPTQPITMPWTFKGPQPINNVPSYGWGNTSGRINAIAVHPTNPNIVFIGTAFGGLAKSVDGGDNWTFVTDGLPSQSISSIIIDTVAPNIIYAGTGDPYYQRQPGVTLLGVGVYRSTDSGTTWALISGGDHLGGGVVRSLAIDPGTAGSQTSTILYAAVSGGSAPGFHSSANSGQTWIQRFSGDGYGVALDPIYPWGLYALERNALWWIDTDINARLDYSPAGISQSNKASFSVHGSTLYAAFAVGGPYDNPTFSTNNSQSGKAFRSIDSGLSWNELTAARGFCGSQCHYDMYVAADPIRPNRIFLGGVDLSSSTNSGVTFKDFSKIDDYLAGRGSPLHADHHSIAFAPSNTNIIYAGNDGGLWKSIDGGATWINKNTNLPGGLIIGVGASGDGNMIAGFQDNGTAINSGGLAWKMVGSGDGGFAKIDPGNSNKLYRTYVVSNYVESNLVKMRQGTNWYDMTPPGTVNIETAFFYPPFFMKPEDFSQIIFGGQNVWRNQGTGWVQIGNLKEIDGSNISAVYQAPGDPDVIYAATGRNRVYVCSYASWEIWADWLQVLNTTTPVTAFAVHPTNPDVAYLTLSGYGTPTNPVSHAFKTYNRGATWSNISSGLPDVPFNDILIDTAAPQNIFAASDVGVFNSIDGGATWTRSDIGIPEGMIVNSLALNTGTRQLVAGTYGRGAYSLTLPPAPPVVAGLAGATQGTSSITWTWTAASAQYNVQAYGVYYATNSTRLLSSGPATSFIWSGLAANTTYGVVVTGANGILESADSPSVVAATLARAPNSGQVGFQVGGTSITASFPPFPASPSSASAAGYLLEASTDPAWGGAIISSRTTNIALSTLAISGLSEYTTYYLRLASLNPLGGANYAALGSTLTRTLLVAPNPVGLSAVLDTSVRADWTSNGNPDGIKYRTEASTATDYSGTLISSETYNLSALLSALSPNTTYYFRVHPSSGPYAILGATVTLASPPGAGSPTFGGVFLSSASLAWSSGGNPLGTRYVAEISSTADFGSAFSSSTYNNSTVFAGLSANTTYSLRVAAVNRAGTASAYLAASTSTLAQAPPTAALRVEITSITVSFSSYPASPRSASAFGYLAEASTDAAFRGVVYSSRTTNIALSTLTVAGLDEYATYYLRLASLNEFGGANFTALGSTLTRSLFVAPGTAPLSGILASATLANWTPGGNPSGARYTVEASAVLDFSGPALSSQTYNQSAAFATLLPDTTYYFRVRASSGPYAYLGSTVTLAFAPGSGSPTLSGVFLSSVAASWNGGGNGLGTRYVAEISSTADFGSAFASSTYNNSAVFAGLSANTTYTLRVAAVNRSGTASAYLAASTSTLAAAPNSGQAGLVVDITSVTVSFPPYPASPRSASAFGYLLEASTDAAFRGVVSASRTANIALSTLTLAGLEGYATYYLRLASLNEPGGANFTALGSSLTRTSLVAPATAAFAGVAEITALANWGLNGNPAGLQYIVQASSFSDFSGTPLEARTYALSALFGTLQPDTSYFFRVRAATGPFAMLGSTITLAYAPGLSTSTFGEILLTRLTVGWSGSGNPLGTRYVADISSAADFGSAVSSSTYDTGAIFSALMTNTTYYLRGRAIGRAGTPTAYFSSAAATLANAPAPGSPSYVLGLSSITLRWAALPVSPSSASCAGFRVEASTSPDFFGVPFINAIAGSATSQLTVAGLDYGATYYLRVGALNWSGVPNYTYLGSTVNFRAAVSSRQVTNALPMSIVLTPLFPQLSRVQVDIPADSLPAGAVVTVNASPAAMPSANSSQATLIPLGERAAVDISAAGAQPGRPLTIAMTYEPSWLPAGADARAIVVGRYVEAERQWSLLPTVVDTKTRLITAETRHLSLFAPFLVSGAQDLSSVQAFPSPWMPGSGDPRFDAPYLSFTGLPSEAKVRIFTLLGELVWEAAATPAGVAAWDGKTRTGSRAGSGTYLAVINAFGSSAARRVVVLR